MTAWWKLNLDVTIKERAQECPPYSSGMSYVWLVRNKMDRPIRPITLRIHFYFANNTLGDNTSISHYMCNRLFSCNEQTSYLTSCGW
jgi:hypothetical protein